jgi:hypothetical protein
MQFHSSLSLRYGGNMLKKAKDFQMPKKLQYDPKKISDTYG